MIDPHATLDEQGVQRQRLDEKQRLGEYVSYSRQFLSTIRPETKRLEQLYTQSQSDAELRDLDRASDDELLDRVYQCGLRAEDLLDRIEILDRRILELRRCRDSGVVWSDNAEQLLKDFEHLRTIYGWMEEALRRWSDQLCDEYERRYPESCKLPFEPLDLEPTNSARLPSVL